MAKTKQAIGKFENGTYKILEYVKPGVEEFREVEPLEVAYDVIGIRREGTYIKLDHIPTGRAIQTVKTHKNALNLVRELMLESDWKFTEPPPGLRDKVQPILDRYRV
jgi:hypothetical protein